MTRLVILRPEPGASATADAARQLGFQPIVLPLFAVEPVGWRAPDPDGYDALLLTSANAIRHGGAGLDRLGELPAHCVGQATATAAREAGFVVGSVGEAGVDALLATLPPGLRLLHLCGADRREPRGARPTIDTLAVYRSAELPPPQGFGAIEDALVAVHSPRAAARLSQLAGELGLKRETAIIAAIGKEAAAAAGAGWRAIEAAPEPTDSALLALAARLCNKPG